MLLLNLLSIEQKQYLRQVKNQALIRQAMYVSIATTLLASGFLYGGRVVVTGNFERFAANDTEETQSINQKIDRINALTGFLETAQQNHYDWPVLLVRVTERIPTDVSLAALAYDREAATVTINGFAPTRDALVALRDALEAMPESTKVRLPIQNLAQQHNITFVITVDIDTT